MSSPGNLQLIINPKSVPSVTQKSALVSIREQDTNNYILFDYTGFIDSYIPSGTVLYIEGVLGDHSSTYINIINNNNIQIGSSGTVELKIESNAVYNQLDKTINVTFGGNVIPVLFDFRSRPQTTDFTLSTADYTIPIIITKEHILAHCSDYDGDAITDVSFDCGTDTNLKYDGTTYIKNTFLPLDTLNAKGLIYTPDVNSLGYTEIYPFLVKDASGLITKI